MHHAAASKRLKGAHSLPLLVQGLLTTWSNTSDPCDNAWAFVSCNCTDTYPVLSPSDCTAAEGDPNSRRVLVLAISGVTRTRGRQLHGPISAAIANLTELRIIDLQDNALSVSPARIRGISEPESRQFTGDTESRRSQSPSACSPCIWSMSHTPILRDQAKLSPFHSATAQCGQS